MPRLFLLIAGVVLWQWAPSLSQSPAVLYGTGTTMGMMAWLLIVLYVRGQEGGRRRVCTERRSRAQRTVLVVLNKRVLNVRGGREQMEASLVPQAMG